jgi:hypothetical protein
MVAAGVPGRALVPARSSTCSRRRPSGRTVVVPDPPAVAPSLGSGSQRNDGLPIVDLRTCVPPARLFVLPRGSRHGSVAPQCGRVDRTRWLGFHRIERALADYLSYQGVSRPGESERRSWQASLAALADDLRVAGLQDIEVLTEQRLPGGTARSASTPSAAGFRCSRWTCTGSSARAAGRHGTRESCVSSNWNMAGPVAWPGDEQLAVEVAESPSDLRQRLRAKQKPAGTPG